LAEAGTKVPSKQGTANAASKKALTIIDVNIVNSFSTGVAASNFMLVVILKNL